MLLRCLLFLCTFSVSIICVQDARPNSGQAAESRQQTGAAAFRSGHGELRASGTLQQAGHLNHDRGLDRVSGHSEVVSSHTWTDEDRSLEKPLRFLGLKRREPSRFRQQQQQQQQQQQHTQHMAMDSFPLGNVQQKDQAAVTSPLSEQTFDNFPQKYIDVYIFPQSKPTFDNSLLKGQESITDPPSKQTFDNFPANDQEQRVYPPSKYRFDNFPPLYQEPSIYPATNPKFSNVWPWMQKATSLRNEQEANTLSVGYQEVDNFPPRMPGGFVFGKPNAQFGGDLSSESEMGVDSFPPRKQNLDVVTPGNQADSLPLGQQRDRSISMKPGRFPPPSHGANAFTQSEEQVDRVWPGNHEAGNVPLMKERVNTIPLREKAGVSLQSEHEVDILSPGKQTFDSPLPRDQQAKSNPDREKGVGDISPWVHKDNFLRGNKEGDIFLWMKQQAKVALQTGQGANNFLAEGQDDTNTFWKQGVKGFLQAKQKLDSAQPRKQYVDNFQPRKQEDYGFFLVDSFKPMKQEVDSFPPRKQEINSFLPGKQEVDNFPPGIQVVDRLPPRKLKIDSFPPMKHDVNSFPSMKQEVDSFPPVKQDVNSFPSMKQEVDSFPPMKQDVNSFSSMKQEVDSFPPMKQDANSFPSMKQEVNSFPPMKQDVNSFPLMKQEVDSLPPMKQDVNSFPPVKHDVNSFQPIKQDINSFPPMKQDVNSFPPMKQEVNNFPPMKQEVNSFSPMNQEAARREGDTRNQLLSVPQAVILIQAATRKGSHRPRRDIPGPEEVHLSFPAGKKSRVSKRKGMVVDNIIEIKEEPIRTPADVVEEIDEEDDDDEEEETEIEEEAESAPQRIRINVDSVDTGSGGAEDPGDHAGDYAAAGGTSRCVGCPPRGPPFGSPGSKQPRGPGKGGRGPQGTGGRGPQGTGGRGPKGNGRGAWITATRFRLPDSGLIVLPTPRSPNFD